MAEFTQHDGDVYEPEATARVRRPRHTIRTTPIGLCWGTVLGATLPELIELAGRYGFPTISVRPEDHVRARAEGWNDARLRRLLADTGVRVSVIDAITADLPGMPPPGTVHPVLGPFRPPSVETCLEAGAALDAGVINICHYRGQPVGTALLAEAVGGICRTASARGLGIVLEFVPASGLPDLAVAHAVAEQCGEPNCSILLDSWHLARSGGTVEDVRRLPPGAIGAMQINDYRAPAPNVAYVPMSGRLMPGEGDLPLADLLDAVAVNSPGVAIDLEVFNDELRMLGLGAAGRAAQALAAWRQAG